MFTKNADLKKRLTAPENTRKSDFSCLLIELEVISGSNNLLF